MIVHPLVIVAFPIFWSALYFATGPRPVSEPPDP